MNKRALFRKAMDNMIRRRFRFLTLVSLVALIGAVLVPGAGTALADPAPCVIRTGIPYGIWPHIATRGACVTARVRVPSESYGSHPSIGLAISDFPLTYGSTVELEIPMNADGYGTFRVPDAVPYGLNEVDMDVIEQNGVVVLGPNEHLYVVSVLPDFSKILPVTPRPIYPPPFGFNPPPVPR